MRHTGGRLDRRDSRTEERKEGRKEGTKEAKERFNLETLARLLARSPIRAADYFA